MARCELIADAHSACQSTDPADKSCLNGLRIYSKAVRMILRTV